MYLHIEIEIFLLQRLLKIFDKVYEKTVTRPEIQANFKVTCWGAVLEYLGIGTALCELRKYNRTGFIYLTDQDCVMSIIEHCFTVTEKVK